MDPSVTSGRYRFWIWGIAALSVVMHLAFYNTLGFHRDELLYFSLGTHPSAGYASVPPFTGIMAYVMIHLAGSNLFSARLLPALLSGVLVIIAARITKELKGGPYARILAAIGILVIPINMRGFYMFQPVFFDVFFWTLIFLIVLKWMNSGKDRYLYLLGMITGVSLLNKYLVLLLLFSFVLVLPFTRYRTLFRHWALYLAVLLALLVFLPNLIWQITHHLPVITHMKALHDSQLVHVSRVSFLTDQLFLGLLSSLLILPALLGTFFSKALKPARPLVAASLLVIFLLCLLRGKSYYTTGVLPFLVCTGAVLWEQMAPAKWVRVVLPSVMILLTIPALPAAIPVWKADKLAQYFEGMRRSVGFDAVLRDEDGNIQKLPQDYADMLGWDELALITSTAWNSLPDKSGAAIYCENYGQAGAITVLGKNFGLPEPVCFSESFFYWAPRDFPKEITSFIYINDELGRDVDSIFSDITVAGSITNPLAREYGTTVYLCRKPVTSFNDFYRVRVKQVESPF
jgi:hypothetical protein